MRNSNIDVYYIPSNIVGIHPSVASVIRSWDGSLYIECNVKELAGANRQINWTQDGIIFINGDMINGGLSSLEKFILNGN